MTVATAPSSEPWQTDSGTWQTRESGDIVFATLPPYMYAGVLAMGIPLIAQVLENEGITSRIVRFTHVPYDAPLPVFEASRMNMFSDPPLEARLARMRGLADRHEAFFEMIVSRLLAGGEPVIGLSVWRVNSDVTVEVARRIKERRPDALIIVGGPETAASPGNLKVEWIDVVVSGQAEGVIVPVVRAMLDGRTREGAQWDNVWVNPRHRPPRHLTPKHAEPPPLPKIDYTRLVPLAVGSTQPVVPVLLNQGCPFRCKFCPNTTMYPDLTWGNPQRVVDEMVQIMGLWKDLHPPGAAPPLEILVCDAALNAYPEQFDRFCEQIIAADWPLLPKDLVTGIIMDGRMTANRIALTRDAMMFPTFFGLESANPRVRRSMKKPGKKEEIAQALRTFRDLGCRNSIRMGVIVGWPDETEAEFQETVEFVEWAAMLDILNGVSVHPLMRLLGMMDEDLLRDSLGPGQGIAWRLPTAGGSPSIRARRHFHVFERFQDLGVVSFLPHHIAVNEMFDDNVKPFWRKWIVQHPQLSHDMRDKDAVAMAESVLLSSDGAEPPAKAPETTAEARPEPPRSTAGDASSPAQAIAAGAAPGVRPPGSSHAAGAPARAQEAAEHPATEAMREVLSRATTGAWHLVHLRVEEGAIHLDVEHRGASLLLSVARAEPGQKALCVVHGLAVWYRSGSSAPSQAMLKSLPVIVSRLRVPFSSLLGLGTEHLAPAAQA